MKTALDAYTTAIGRSLSSYLFPPRVARAKALASRRDRKPEREREREKERAQLSAPVFYGDTTRAKVRIDPILQFCTLVA